MPASPHRPSDPQPLISKALVLLLKLGVTVALLVLLLRRVDWQLMARSISQLQGEDLSLALLFFLLVTGIETVRLRVILAGFQLARLRLLRLHLHGAFVASFLPGQLGSDLYKAVVLRSPAGGGTRALTLLLLLRALGLAVLLSAAILTLLPYGHGLHRRLTPGRLLADSPLLAAVLAAATLVLVLALLLPAVRQRAAAMVKDRRHQVRQALAEVTSRQITKLLALSVLLLACRAGVIVFLVHSIGAPLKPGEAVLVVSAATIVSTLPISFAGLGLREGVVAFLLAHLGMSYEGAVLAALLGRALIFLQALAGGCLLLTDLGRHPMASCPSGLKRR